MAAELARLQESRRDVGERSKTLRLSFGEHGTRSIASASAALASAALMEQRSVARGRMPLWDQLRPGQLLELSGHAPGKLSTVSRLIARAQAEGEPVAWIGVRDTASFYPPDFVLAGVELASLVMVRMPVEQGSHELLRASELLLRSGAFGLVVIDFGADAGSASARSTLPRGELSWQARLSGLVRKHDARMVLLTASAPDVPSLGPLIGLRVEPELSLHASGRALLTPRVLKSKLGEERALSPDVRSLPVGARP